MPIPFMERKQTLRMITLECKYCQREYSVRYAIGIRSKKNFCSRKCYNKYRMNGELKRCLECGKSFYVQKSWKDQQFCSRACQSVHSRVTLICKQCGSRFELTKHRAKEGRDFCSSTYRNLVIECDGGYWHSLEKNTKNDIKKNTYMAKAGIALVRLKENDIRVDCEGLIRLTLKQYPMI